MKTLHLLWITFAAVLTLLLAGCGNIATPDPQEDARMGATATAAATAWPRITPQAELPSTGASMDQLLIDLVVPYQQAALTIAEAAQTGAEHTELKDFAAHLISTQPDEIKRLQDLRQQWFGRRETPALDERPVLMELVSQGGQAATPQALVDRFNTTTADRNASLDLAFIDAMLEHHQILIAAAQMVLGQAQHVETKQLAQDLIDVNSREIERLMAFRTQWMSGLSPLPASPTPGLQTRWLPPRPFQPGPRQFFWTGPWMTRASGLIRQPEE